MASEDAIYRESSQYRLWSFSPPQLATLRTQTNELARTSIEERRVDKERHTQAHGEAGDAPAAAPDYLTPAEERLLLDFYTVELLRAAKFTEQPTDVQATAAVFFKRFYVTHSIMTYPPAALFKTALFFGAKSEGYYHKLDGFAEKFPNTKAADILAGEFLLCQGIRFAFDVKHPYRALEGAVMELRRLADVDAARGQGITDTQVSAAHRRAREILKFSPLVTDAYFHYSPSQIMLSALWLADQALVERLLQDTFARPASLDATPLLPGGANASKKKRNEAEWERVSGGEVRERVMGAIEDCSKLLATELPERLEDYWGTPEAVAVIKPLSRKLKNCRDPDRMNLVALQQAKKEGSVKTYTKTVGAGGEGSKGSSAEGDGAVFGKNLNMVPGDGTPIDSSHEAKRRKVGRAVDDPFGPPLG